MKEINTYERNKNHIYSYVAMQFLKNKLYLFFKTWYHGWVMFLIRNFDVIHKKLMQPLTKEICILIDRLVDCYSSENSTSYAIHYYFAKSTICNTSRRSFFFIFVNYFVLTKIFFNDTNNFLSRDCDIWSLLTKWILRRRLVALTQQNDRHYSAR